MGGHSTDYPYGPRGPGVAFLSASALSMTSIAAGSTNVTNSTDGADGHSSGHRATVRITPGAPPHALGDTLTATPVSARVVLSTFPPPYNAPGCISKTPTGDGGISSTGTATSTPASNASKSDIRRISHELRGSGPAFPMSVASSTFAPDIACATSICTSCCILFPYFDKIYPYYSPTLTGPLYTGIITSTSISNRSASPGRHASHKSGVSADA